MSRNSYIIHAKRPPIGSFGGSLPKVNRKGVSIALSVENCL